MNQPRGLALLSALLVVLGGCQVSPLNTSAEPAMRRSLVDMVRRELLEPAGRPGRQITVQDMSEEDFIVKFDLGQFEDQIMEMAGPDSYVEAFGSLPMDENFFGETHEVVGLSLKDAVGMALEQNLQVQFARLTPSINGAQVAEAEAAFDWVFFSSVQFQDTETPIVDRSTAGFGLGGDFRRSTDVAFTAGIRRLTTAGGQLTLQQEVGYNDSDERGLALTPNPANRASLTAQYDQPLLRNFGSRVALAQVRISQNAERAAVANLKSELNRVLTDTERAYWQLVRAYYDLMILERLTERGRTVLAQVQARRDFDVNRAQIANAAARVQGRIANMGRARNGVRLASDRLKALINHPDLAVSSEVLILPVDLPLAEPIEFSLADAIVSALDERPEIAQAILSIDDTTIRQVVAENARLAQLDLRVQVRYQALEDDFRTAYATTLDQTFFDASIGLFYEIPIGNRAGEAVLRRRLLERQQAVLSFENTTQQVLLEVKNSLNNLKTNFELIEQEKLNRIAQAENLRVLQVRKENLPGGYSIEQLETELNQQERLSNSERDEIQALVDYAVSLAESHQAMGTTLRRNRVDFVVPDVEG